MVKSLPSRFNPDLIARDGTRFETEVPLDQLPRLSALLLLDVEGVSVSLPIISPVISALFSRRKDVIVVNGRIRASYPLQCQRCLEPMVTTIDEPYELVFVGDEQAAEKLSKGLDPVILDDKGYIRVVDLFEDELILHVPAIPKHAEGERCVPGDRQFGELPAAVKEDEEGRRRPFEVLKDLNLH